MPKLSKLNETPKQKEAIRLISKNKITLLEGGSRSGKTLLFCYALIVRAFHVPSKHLITRFRFAHAKQSICYETMPDLLRMLHLKDKIILNKSDWFYEFPNGSTIWISGLDDKERTEKMLGNEFSTIFFNEASQISYDSYEIAITRLNPAQGLRGKIFIDYNPPSIAHWGYKIFHDRKFPDGRKVPENDYVYLKINPGDNEFTSKEYLETLQSLSAAKRKRFLEGEYSSDMGSLWKRNWMKYKEPPIDLQRIVIGVDPSGSVDGDEVGIIITGIRDHDYYVLDDFSLHGTPNEWASMVNSAYEKWHADIVVAEKNFGGDMVESTLKNVNPGMNVKLVTASRGKIVRAEPVSALYEQGKVYHRTMFNELEDECCNYTPETDKSPNRMDGLVWAISELSGEGLSIWDV
jgi:hypothetical protein